MKKIIASYLKDDGSWEPQQEIETGPLESAAINADWDCGKKEKEEPKKLSLEDRVNALSNPLQGAAFIAQSDANYTLNYNSWKADYDKLDSDRQAKWKAYNDQMTKLPPGTKTC